MVAGRPSRRCSMERAGRMARELTGRHVLAITLAAFGVVIGVNLLLAVKAVGTFPGVEVSNSYVASQVFDRERSTQAEELASRVALHGANSNGNAGEGKD